MKKIFLIIICIQIIFLLTNCASVKSQGMNYFIGKKESDLIKHFGYNGVEVDSSNTQYDKILFFTNRILTYQMSKTNVVRYKNQRQSVVIDAISFNQFRDGCLVILDNRTYGNHYEEDMYGNILRHINDNAYLVPLVNQFNSIKNMNNSYPNSQRSTALNRHNIGDTYYLYEERREAKFIGESYTGILLAVWRIDVVAEDRSEVDRQNVVRFNERLNQCYDRNGNPITFERANSLLDGSINNGFTRNIFADGHSVHVYISDEKIINVEENKMAPIRF
jgi:hypothetical protein